MIELSGFLKEMLCPFQSFITGPVSQRFLFVESRLIILDYLLTELMAMKMCHKLKPKENVVIEVVSFSLRDIFFRGLSVIQNVLAFSPKVQLLQH